MSKKSNKKDSNVINIVITIGIIFLIALILTIIALVKLVKMIQLKEKLSIATKIADVFIIILTIANGVFICLIIAALA